MIGHVTEAIVALFTSIIVYEGYCREGYEGEITLPLRCYELEPVWRGGRYRVSDQLDNYPKFNSIYTEYFKKDFPARAVLEVSRIPADGLIEIMMIAVK